MVLNLNHNFEDLDGIKCSVVEKHCSSERASFLKELLKQNKFTVIVVKSPISKVVPVAAAGKVTPEQLGTPPETFTVGVTDVSFNPVNAVYNRELKTADGTIVSSDYWEQKVAVSNPEKWYWKK